jgi:hypothetical protein
MDCKIFRSLVEPRLINDATKKALSRDFERHLQSCAVCRDRYASQFEYNNIHDQVIPDTAELKAISPSVDDLLDPFPDISDPVEFKDVPLTFTLLLNGREEKIKMVEPEVDFPLPEGGRLVVREKETRLTDVVFRFHPEKERPYQLHFTVKAGVSYAEPQVLTYGNPEIYDKGFNDVYAESIVARGGLKEWVDGSFLHCMRQRNNQPAMTSVARPMAAIGQRRSTSR